MERDKALEMALGQIDKQFGKGSVMRMGDKTHMGIESIPTGAMALDLALGVGGLPRGRVVEIYGPESSGKSTLAMHVVAEAQRNGGICAYIDAEHAMDPVYAAAIGVNVDELLISQPDTGEQALEIADMLIRSGALDVLVIDSVAALTPRAEIEGDMGDSHMGLQARLMSQALRKITATLNRSNTVAIFINQLREKIGVMFGSPETTPGGKALKFYSSVRLDIRRIESIKDGAEVVGNRVRVKVVKNKCVAAGTTIFDPTSGLTHRIEDVVERGEGSAVVAADKAGKLHVRPIVERFDQGEREVIGLHLRDGTALWVTPDHLVLTDTGWREAGDLGKGDLLARPRQAVGFGEEEPVAPGHARMLGYLIGAGHAGGETPIRLLDVAEPLRQDAVEIAQRLGFDSRRGGIETSFSQREADSQRGGEKDLLLELARSAGVCGHPATTRRVPAPFFAPETSAGVVGNLLFGLLETGGWVSREQAGGLEVGFRTTSVDLARQVHWLLLRWGIASSVGPSDPARSRASLVEGRGTQGGRPCWQVRVSGIDDARRLAAAVPMWGPRGQELSRELDRPELRRHRGSSQAYLPPSQTRPVLAYLRGRGVTGPVAAQLLGRDAAKGRSGLDAVVGARRLRRDSMQVLADALDSDFLRQVLDEDLWYDKVVAVSPPERRAVYDIEVDEHHTFVADDVVVHNCASPFKQAEFDIQFGRGISREGSVLDIAVDQGIAKKSGAWYTYEGEQLGQGRENAKQFLLEHPEVMVELNDRIRRQAGIGGAGDGMGDGMEEADVPLGEGVGDDEPITVSD